MRVRALTQSPSSRYYSFRYVYSGIEDISVKSSLPKVLLKVEEKFRLDLSDEQAEQFFLGLISESLNAIAPRIMEIMHKIAVARR
jgi:phosphatidylinositol 3-kinase